jgi:hypothetical protein
MKKVCKDCKFYKDVDSSTGFWIFFWIFKMKPTERLCMHQDARDEVSGEPNRCSLMRNLPATGCGTDAKWFEEKE